MTKNKMNVKYKQPKRVRNKVQVDNSIDTSAKSIIKTTVGVLAFIGIIYLCILGLDKLGLFQEGYDKPSTEVSFDYEYIPVGTIFNRSENTYYVLFDDFSDLNKDTYIETLLKDFDGTVYKVDMSKTENKKYLSDKENKNVSKVKDLKIKDVTLIKIVKGKNAKYISGRDNVEKYLK